jgi:hypothetical protein
MDSICSANCSYCDDSHVIKCSVGTALCRGYVCLKHADHCNTCGLTFCSPWCSDGTCCQRFEDGCGELYVIFDDYEQNKWDAFKTNYEIAMYADGLRYKNNAGNVRKIFGNKRVIFHINKNGQLTNITMRTIFTPEQIRDKINQDRERLVSEINKLTSRLKRIDKNTV